MTAKEFIKARHNGELPYQYGTNECATLMEDYGKQENDHLLIQLEGQQSLLDDAEKKNEELKDLLFHIDCNHFLDDDTSKRIKQALK